MVSGGLGLEALFFNREINGGGESAAEKARAGSWKAKKCEAVDITILRVGRTYTEDDECKD